MPESVILTQERELRDYLHIHLSRPFKLKVNTLADRWDSEMFRIKYGTTISVEACKALIKQDDYLRRLELMEQGREPFEMPSLNQPKIEYIHFKDLLQEGRVRRDEIDRIYLNALAVVEMLESQGLVGSRHHSRYQVR